MGINAPLIACSLLLWAGVNVARAEPLQDVVNNFSHGNLICGAYSLFVHQCLKNKDPNDVVAANYLTLGNNFLKRGIETGKTAGLSEKAITAKIEIAIEEMKDDTENDCINISVLFKRHAKTCKFLYDDGPQKFSDDIKKLGVK